MEYICAEYLVYALLFDKFEDKKEVLKYLELDNRTKTLCELFKELSEAIEEELKAKSDDEKHLAKEKVKKAFVKLFYCAV
jgi:hypothetical protein